MNQLLKIDNIMYFVADLKRSEKFYVEFLGLKKAWSDEERSMVGFTFPESDSEIVIQSGMSNVSFDYSFLVTDVREYCNEAQKQGITIKTSPTAVRCGYFAVLSDPDGNSIPIIDLSAFGGKPQYN